MSMLSSQCDELREYAKRADGTFPLLSGALRNAADIILELRDDLQRANNDLQDAEHDESMAWDRVRKADRENAKLKKLTLDVHALHWSGLDCTECPWIDECDTDGGCPWLGIMRDHMQELGIEVPQ